MVFDPFLRRPVWKGASSSFSFDWESIVLADVAGAAGGATYAVVFNIVPGGGQVAYGATILATAAGASVVEGIVAIYDFF